jgi:hypothetical protein
MTPVLPRFPAYELWLVWLATAVALLVAKPWGVFGWEEWLAVTAPLLLIHPAVRSMDVFIVGLAASSLAWFFLGDQSGGWPELACLWGVIAIGTVFGSIAIRDSREGQSQPGVEDRMTNEDVFFAVLNRELCRARRDESSFVVLSVDRKTADTDTSLRSVCELLDAELRAYADIAQVGNRVLVLVPAVGGSQYEPLLKRLTAKSEDNDIGEIRIGLARFPEDAICAEDLMDIADRKRLVRGVSQVDSANQIHASGQAVL